MIHGRQPHSSSSNKEREYLAGWQRSRADLANFRKRMQTEQAKRDQRAKSDLIAGLLPIIDNFEAIVSHRPAELADDSWAAGVLHVARQLQQVLAQYHVEQITQTNVPFDPSIHQAVTQVKTDAQKSGTVLAVVQPGYRLDDTIIRPAKVTVVA